MGGFSGNFILDKCHANERPVRVIVIIAPPCDRSAYDGIVLNKCAAYELHGVPSFIALLHLWSMMQTPDLWRRWLCSRVAP